MRKRMTGSTTIALLVFHTGELKSNIALFKVSQVFTSSPPAGHEPGAKSYGMEVDPPRYPWSKYEYVLMSGW